MPNSWRCAWRPASLRWMSAAGQAIAVEHVEQDQDHLVIANRP